LWFNFLEQERFCSEHFQKGGIMAIHAEVAVQNQSPFLTIWTKPRETIRHIVDINSTQYVLLLAILVGIGNTFSRTYARLAPENSEDFVGDLLFSSFIMGPIGGIISLYVIGAILRWTGSMFGGRANAEDVRAAVAWSYVPTIAGYMLFIPLQLLALFLGDVGTGAFWDVFWLGLGWFQIIVGIGLTLWSFAILVNCIAEVHQLSGRQALIAVLIPGMFVLLLIAIIAGLTLVGPALR
jgi:hypothetical protein